MSESHPNRRRGDSLQQEHICDVITWRLLCLPSYRTTEKIKIHTHTRTHTHRPVNVVAVAGLKCRCRCRCFQSRRLPGEPRWPHRCIHFHRGPQRWRWPSRTWQTHICPSLAIQSPPFEMSPNGERGERGGGGEVDMQR